MPYFFLGIALLVIAILLARWFVEADPKRVAASLRYIAIGALALITLVLVVSGNISLLMLLYMMLFFARRMFRAGRQRVHAMHGPSAGQSSEVQTRFLRMILDHDSGEMDGEILDGRFAGSRLSQLTLGQLLQLLEDYEGEDPQSASILEAFLDRTQSDWREQAGADQDGEGRREGAGDGPMSREEALEILGLEEGASAAQIREAHRRLMQKIHPDHGGSNYLAAKLNEAKDLLLGT